MICDSRPTVCMHEPNLMTGAETFTDSWTEKQNEAIRLSQVRLPYHKRLKIGLEQPIIVT